MKVLLIQTAFIGDVILATAVIEKLKQHFPASTIDFILQKGNESLLTNHPHIRKVIIFDKKKNKYSKLLHLIKDIRKESYDYVINMHRFFSSGLITCFSGAKTTTGFKKNPLSFCFSHSVDHHIGDKSLPSHEVDRNQALIRQLTGNKSTKPRLYPASSDYTHVDTQNNYIVIAPASIWFTKQFPAKKWIELINLLPDEYKVYLIGAKNDMELCEHIQEETKSKKVEILAGQLSFLQSAALIKHAKMTFTNDSAPAHLASAMNAPVTMIFCSTVPEFGFGPLSNVSYSIEVDSKLNCRPCGLHGKKKCPEGHFNCAEIKVNEIVSRVLS
ncbi:glycosyltransferase family 9 protein [Bacteroidota bacterium]